MQIRCEDSSNINCNYNYYTTCPRTHENTCRCEGDSKELPVKLPTGGSKIIKNVNLLNTFEDIL